MLFDATRFTPVMLLTACLLACRERTENAADSGRASLPPVFPQGPSKDTNWDVDAGPFMIASSGNGDSSAFIVLPEVTDNTLQSAQDFAPSVSGLAFDLFGRSGKVGRSTTIRVLSKATGERDCDAWPIARLRAPQAGWRVGFVSNRVSAVRLDSIGTLPSTDSAALAAALAKNAATSPAASDPTFRGLPFRVRDAYAFRLDSTTVVVGDLVRTLNEEANPRLEQLLLVAEKPAGRAENSYALRYYNRSAGAEESIQAEEVLAVIQINGRPVVVLGIEYGNGRRFALLERATSGEWRTTWRSAYTDC